MYAAATYERNKRRLDIRHRTI